MTESKASQSNKDNRFPEVKAKAPTDVTPYIQPVIGQLGWDTKKPGLFGLGASPDNGATFHVFATFDGLVIDDDDIENQIWPGTVHKVQDEVDKATAEIPIARSAAESAVRAADSAITASKVNSDAILAQNSAVNEAKSAMDSATAEIQQTIANAASDAAKIRATVDKVQSEVNSAKSANEATVNQLKSEVADAKKHLSDVNDQLDKAAAANSSALASLNSSVASMQTSAAANASEVQAVRKDLEAEKSNFADLSKQLSAAKSANDAMASQMDSDVATIRKGVASNSAAIAGYSKQLNSAAADLATYAKSAAEQGKDIAILKKDNKTLSAALADTNGNVTKAQQTANSAQVTASDNAKNISSLRLTASAADLAIKNAKSDIAVISATADKVSSMLKDQGGRISTVEQTAAKNASTIADVQSNVSSVEQTADGVKTTVANQAKDITEIKTTAKGQDARITNAEKAVNDVQSDVNGLKETVSDNKGNVAKLQTSATQFESDIKDAKGNISKIKQTADGAQIAATNNAKDISKLKISADGASLALENAKKEIASIKVTADGLQSSLQDQDGRLSTIEQTSKEQSTTLSDVKGNITQVKQTADGLTKTLKDAQGNITQLQTTAKGTEEKIANAQGAITTIKKTVDGLSVTSTNNEKDIHTLKVNASQFESDIKDAKGNISSLQQTAKSLVSSIADAKGNISKFEQTANGIKQTVADAQGNISNLQQTAKGLQTTLANAQGDINNIRVTAQGLDAKLTTQGNDIATIKANASGFSTRLSGVEKSGSELANKLNNLQIGNRNLLHNTSDQYRTVAGDGWMGVHTSSDIYTSVANYHGGDQFTYAATVNNASDVPVELQVWKCDQNKNRLPNGMLGTSPYVQPGQSNVRVFLTGQIDGNTWYLQSAVYSSGGQSGQHTIQLKDERLIEGSTPGSWSPNPDDIADKITTNTTSINQTKKMIELKADQSTVNNLTGEVEQNKAQLKVQADQISSKVSSAEYQGLKDKVNNLHTGGENLIQDGNADAYNATPWPNTHLQTHSFYYNGTKKMFNLDTASKTELVADNNNWFPVEAGKQYILHFKGFMSWNVISYDVWLLGKKAGAQGSWSNSYPVISGQKLSNGHCETVTKIFTVPNDWNDFVAYIRFDNNGSANGQDSVFFFNEVSLKEGNVNTGYSASPYDEIELIKKNSTAIDQTNKAISLKADQTVVDKIKNTAQQNSSRLDVMANEIKLKVNSTDVNNIVNSKGYVTQSTTQSLIDQKAGTISESITQLDAKYKDKDGVNIVKKSSFHHATLDELRDCWNIGPDVSVNASNPNGGSIVIDAKQAGNGYRELTQTIPLSPDTDYQMSFKVDWAEVSSGKSFSAFTYIVERDAKGNTVYPYVDHGRMIANSDDRSKNTFGFHTSSTTQQGLLYLRAFGGTKIELEEVKVERGKVATPWTPAPSDNATITQIQSITATIDGIQSNVRNKADSSQVTQLAGVVQSKVSNSDFNSKVTQLANDINLRVTKGSLMSQINLEAGRTLIQSNKLYLDAGTVAFSGKAFIPDAAIARISADKIFIPGSNGTYAAIGASVAQYDQDRIKSTINLQYNGGFEIHSSNNLGSILTMHDDTIRLASKSQVYAAGSGKPADQQYSGVWFGKNYALLNAVDREGKTTGWAIGGNGVGPGNSYRANLYDTSTTIQPSYGVSVETSRFDIYSSEANLYVGPDKAEIRGNEHATVHGGMQTYLEGGDQQIYIHNGEVTIGKPNDTSNPTGVHFRVFGYGTFNGYVEAMGWTTKSTLSSKTRIEKLDTKEALDKVLNTDLETYQYKAEVEQGMTKRHAGLIIDDVHDVAQYNTPDEFINEQRTGRSDADVIGYLMGAVQEQQKQIEQLKEKITNG